MKENFIHIHIHVPKEPASHTAKKLRRLYRSALAFAGEPSLASYMRCPPISREEKLLTGEMIRRMIHRQEGE